MFATVFQVNYAIQLKLIHIVDSQGTSRDRFCVFSVIGKSFRTFLPPGHWLQPLLVREDKEYVVDKDGVIRSVENLRRLEDVKWVVLSLGGNDTQRNQSDFAVVLQKPALGGCFFQSGFVGSTNLATHGCFLFCFWEFFSCWGHCTF